MRGYGKRECIVCGKIFDPSYASQVVCSAECMDKRKKQLKGLSNKKYRLKIREMVSEFLKNKEIIDSLKSKIALLEKENAELKTLIEKDGGVNEKERAILNFKKKNNMQHCQRLHLETKDLPCGQFFTCWQGDPCEKTAGMAKPDFKNSSFM